MKFDLYSKKGNNIIVTPKEWEMENFKDILRRDSALFALFVTTLGIITAVFYITYKYNNTTLTIICMMIAIIFKYFFESIFNKGKNIIHYGRHKNLLGLPYLLEIGAIFGSIYYINQYNNSSYNDPFSHPIEFSPFMFSILIIYGLFTLTKGSVVSILSILDNVGGNGKYDDYTEVSKKSLLLRIAIYAILIVGIQFFAVIFNYKINLVEQVNIFIQGLVYLI